MKKAVAFLLVAVLCIGMVLSGCAAQPAASSAPSSAAASSAAAPAQSTEASAAASVSASSSAELKPVTIAFLLGVAGDAFYISMQKGMQAKLKELFGDKVTFIAQGETTWDYTKQVPMVESMIAKKVDMLIIAPNNADAMVAPLKKCVDAGIPVITVDTNISDDSFYLANITSDNLQGGAAAADEIASLTNSKGNVAIINTIAGVTTTDARQKGFEDQVAAKYPDIKIVSKQYCNNEEATAAAQVQDIVLKYPDLGGVFAVNLFAAVGASTGISSKGLKVPIVCYDAGPDQIESLKKGTITATVCQKPLAIGEKAAEYAYDYFTNQKDKIEKSTLIPSVIATQQNMNDPDVSKWFYTTSLD